LARFAGLHMPFVVAIIITALVLLWALFAFPADAKAIGRNRNTSQQLLESPEETLEEETAAVPDEKLAGKLEGNPFCDVPIMLLTVSQGILMVFSVMAIVLIVPTMLFQNPAFGVLVPGDTQETGERVSQVMGLLQMPAGGSMLFFTLFVYVPVTKRVAEIKVFAISGLLAAVFLASYAYSSTVWQLGLCQFFLGGGCALLVAGVPPLLGAYANIFYPNSKAKVQGAPVLALSLAQVFGQQIAGLLLESVGPRLVWIVGAAFFCVAAFCQVLGTRIINQRIRQATRTDLSAAQKDIFKEHRGLNPDKYVAKSVRLFEETLNNHKHQLWNGAVQALVTHRIETTVPDLPPFSEKDHGGAYLDELRYHIEMHPELRKKYGKMFENRMAEQELPMEIGARFSVYHH